VEAASQNVENSALVKIRILTPKGEDVRPGLQSAFVAVFRQKRCVNGRTMGNRVDSEAHSQAQGHGPVHHPSFQNAFSSSPAHIVEKLVRLKNSDPELFTEAWNRLPGSVRENILSYLKKYPKLLEGEYPLLLLHRAGDLSKNEVEDFEGRASTVDHRSARPLESSPETQEPVTKAVRKKEPSQKSRPRTVNNRAPEKISEERSDSDSDVRAPLTVERREGTRGLPKADADSLLLAELRKISRQNKTQIGLMRRLVETSKGKGRTAFSFSKDR
jgi:hypothetical protein